MSVLIAVAVGLLIDQGVVATEPVGLDSVRRTLHVATGAFFFGAGLLQLVLWRVTGDSRCIHSGLLLVLLGVLAPWIVSLGHLVHGNDEQATLSSLTTTAIAVVSLLIGLSTLVRDWTVTLDRPLLVAGFLTLLFLLLLTAPLLVTSRMMVDYDTRVALLLELGVALAWTTMAALTHVQLKRDSDRVPALSADLLVTLAVVWLLRAAAVLDLQPWSVAAAVLLLLVGLVALSLSATEFTENLDAEASRAAEREHGLHAVTLAYEALDRQRQNVSHDARNVFMALRIASGTLQEHGEDLDPLERRRLRAAIAEEITHLEHLITADQPAHATTFEAHTVVASVVELERLSGLEVATDLEPCRAVGVPGDLARVLRNLLVNARHHAPGSTVQVDLRVAGPLVRIVVRDDGPGIATHVRRRLYSRGASSRLETTGSGLGLHISRALMQQQGGSLELAEGPGTRFFLTLPADSAHLVSELIPAQRRPVSALRLTS